MKGILNEETNQHQLTINQHVVNMNNPEGIILYKVNSHSSPQNNCLFSNMAVGQGERIQVKHLLSFGEAYCWRSSR